MAEFKEMTVAALRELARKLVGRGHSKLKTKRELIEALEAAQRKVAHAADQAAVMVKEATGRVRDVTERAARATERATERVVQATEDAAGRVRDVTERAARAAEDATERVVEAVFGKPLGERKGGRKRREAAPGPTTPVAPAPAAPSPEAPSPEARGAVSAPVIPEPVTASQPAKAKPPAPSASPTTEASPVVPARSATPARGRPLEVPVPPEPVRAPPVIPTRLAPTSMAAPARSTELRTGAAPAPAAPSAARLASSPPQAMAGSMVAAAALAAAEPDAAPGPAEPAPEAHLVARVGGEPAARAAPIPLTESALDARGSGRRPARRRLAPPTFPEQLGELPREYADDLLMAIPRDPQTLFVYWDHAAETVRRTFEGLEDGRTQLWLFERGDDDGWRLVRVVDFALDARSYYLHDLEPGRTYRVEIHVVGRGEERLLPSRSNPMTLPVLGPSSVVDDRFMKVLWSEPVQEVLREARAGTPFAEELRAEVREQLASLSDWSRHSVGPPTPSGAGPAEQPGADGPAREVSAGGVGGRYLARPTSPAGGWSRPVSPSSPHGPWQASGSGRGRS